MKKNSLLSGATLLFAMLLAASCGGKSSAPAPTSSGSDTGTTDTTPEIVESEFSVKKAREAEEGAEITVEGIVAQITTNNNQSPDGFIIIDEFASIYVYGADIAPYVSIGNKVKVKGTKTWYVLEKEQTYADKFGYKGSCQINATELISDDEKNHEIPTNSIERTTVKKIMDTDCSEDITTKVYEVVAYIKRAEGQGFVNYYIDDLDGKTGSYVYTKSNGADIDKAGALKPYDGKVCRMYLTAINAKSSTTGCVWRFIPIKVVEPDYEFGQPKVPEFVIEYYVADQFASVYNSNPNMEVVSTVSNDIIPFEGVNVSYTTNNPSVAYFEKADGVTTFKTDAIGEAKITAKATYERNGKTYEASRSFDIAVEEAPQIPSVTVAEAQAAELNSEVTVKGIVASSLVNQAGFYLIDETGTIAVKTSEDIKSTYSIGDEVIIKAKRDQMSKGTQTLLSDAQCLLNLYGDHSYSKASFITGKTATEIAQISKSEDHSLEVYTVSAQISKSVSTYATNYFVTDNPDEKNGLTLYASSGNQYAWLDAYVGEGVVSVDVAICNWNGNNTRGCVISVTDSNGTVINNLNFR